MRHPLKDKIKFWLYFLRLAHQIDDKVIQNNLKKKKAFYARWGDIHKGNYNDWWRKHSSLFRDNVNLSRMNVGEVCKDDAFYLRVPYIFAPVTLGKIVANMYKKELEAQEEANKKKTRVKKKYGGEYTLTATDDYHEDTYRVEHMKYYYVFAKDVYMKLMNTKATQREWHDLTTSVFKKKFKKQTSREKRPHPFTTDTSYESDMRQIRRYKNSVAKLLVNVSNGIFPGDYVERAKTHRKKFAFERMAEKNIAKYGNYGMKNRFRK